MNEQWQEQLEQLQVPDHVTQLEEAISSHQVLMEQIHTNYTQVHFFTNFDFKS